ncbi:MAG: hypothetical protein AAFM92_07045 [Pseudomonadota bacterium]
MTGPVTGAGKEVIYGFDPLCGWCFGLIPAWHAARAAHPDLAVEVLPGGLITGPRVGPYKDAAPYIRGAAPRMAAATGQHVSDAFLALIEAEDSPVSASAPPSHALLQAPAEARLDFAHALQEAHFRDGQDITSAPVLAAVAAAQGLTIDAHAAARVSEDTEPVRAAFQRSAALAITTFPTTLILRDGVETARIDGIYDPEEFTATLSRALEE